MWYSMARQEGGCRPARGERDEHDESIEVAVASADCAARDRGSRVGVGDDAAARSCGFADWHISSAAREGVGCDHGCRCDAVVADRVEGRDAAAGQEWIAGAYRGHGGGEVEDRNAIDGAAAEIGESHRRREFAVWGDVDV